MICVKFTALCDMRIRLATLRKSVRTWLKAKERTVFARIVVRVLTLLGNITE